MDLLPPPPHLICFRSGHETSMQIIISFPVFPSGIRYLATQSSLSDLRLQKYGDNGELSVSLTASVVGSVFYIKLCFQSRLKTAKLSGKFKVGKI